MLTIMIFLLEHLVFMISNSYRPGDHWMLCDQCGRRMRSSESTTRWDGLIVHRDESYGCNETRHPQEFVRAIRDQRILPWIRPEPADLEDIGTVNCSAHFSMWITPSYIEDPIVNIYNGYSDGPVTITDGCTVTVYCTWEILE